MNDYRIAIPQSGFQPPVYYCKRATKPFHLDGNINKEFWADAPFTDLFVDIEGDIRPKPRYETRAKMLWDDENLYFGAVLYGDEIWATLTERDCVIFYDNDFEIFIDPDSDTHQYFEFEMNALNTVWDLFLTKPYRDRGGRPLNGWDIKGLKTAVHIEGTLNDANADNRCWMVEVVMPFAALKEMAQDCRTPRAGDYYRVNFSRVQWLVDQKEGRYEKRINPETGRAFPEDNWVWAPTGLINIHYPELWGFVFFTENGESYDIPAVEYIKWELRRIYYYEHRYFDDYGHFTADLDALEMPEKPAICPRVEVMSEGFVLSCDCPQEEKRVLLYDDGKVEVLDRAQMERRLRCIPPHVKKQATEEELKYLDFLYRNMPLSDLTECEEDYFLRVVRQALYVRSHTPWGKTLSEELFCNYVLPYRINNEHITFYQKQFWQALSERLFAPEKEEMTLYRAAVEVNYWCLEKATYQSTNARTASSLTVLNNAFGRCGEESTLAVAALRSVGIPARQCYAPRWSHCDDNHAWVEVYTEDGWHFLGACEPELFLDRGWFCLPASKAMLIHTKVNTDGLGAETENAVSTDGTQKEINVLEHYAKTRPLCVRVTDAQGTPVRGAKVAMQVVNYSEFYPILSLVTDETGCVRTKTGWGDLLLHASKDGVYTTGCFHGRDADEETVTLVLDTCTHETEGYDFTFLPPVGGVTAPAPLTEAEQAEQERRGSHAVQARQAFEASFLAGESAEREAKRLGDADLAPVLEKARGNAAEIIDFVAGLPMTWRETAKELLTSLEQKDLSDTTAQVLNGHLQHAMEYQGAYPHEVFVQDLMNPRIHLEVLTDYKKQLEALFTPAERQAMRTEPARLWQWVNHHIFLYHEPKDRQARQTPGGIWKLGAANETSMKVFYVAVCRSLGIPARIEKSDGSVSYYHQGEYHRIGTQDDTEASGLLVLKRPAKSLLEYDSHVTVGKLENGEYQTLRFGHLSWKDDCLECPVQAGHYRVIVTNRQPDESNPVRVDFITVEAGARAELALRKPEAKAAGKQVELTNTVLYDVQDACIDVAQVLAKQEKTVLCYLGTSQEPTEHLLNEMIQMSEYFTAMDAALVFVLQKNEETADPTLSKAVQALGRKAQLFFTKAPFELSADYAAFDIQDARLPLVIVAQNGKGSYAWAGYQVGIGDMILKCL